MFTLPKKTTRAQLWEEFQKLSREKYEADKKIVLLSRERDLLAAENAQMSTALSQLAAESDKEGTPGWWRVIAARYQMEATRLRDLIAYALNVDGGYNGEGSKKFLQMGLRNIGYEVTEKAAVKKPAPAPAAEPAKTTT